MDIDVSALNVGLYLSMEFGENWLMPINDRMHVQFPNLSTDELEYCNTLCKKINTVANQYVYMNPIKKDDHVEFPKFDDFRHFMLNKYGWISDNNLSNLYSQSCYYALK